MKSARSRQSSYNITQHAADVRAFLDERLLTSMLDALEQSAHELSYGFAHRLHLEDRAPLTYADLSAYAQETMERAVMTARAAHDPNMTFEDLSAEHDHERCGPSWTQALLDALDALGIILVQTHAELPDLGVCLRTLRTAPPP
jgi:hypothetical protein